MAAPCRHRRELLPDPALPQLLVARSPSPPALPHHASQPMPYPLVQVPEHSRGLTESIVASPAPHVLAELRHHVLQADSPAPPGYFSHSLLKSLQRPPRDAALRFPALFDYRESEKFALLCRPLLLHVTVRIVCVPAVAQPPSLKLLVQLVQ